MSIIQVRYHLDEYLPDLDVPLRAGTVITADLPAGDVWGRLGALYRGLAAAVAVDAGRGQRPVVVSGDCLASLGTMSGLQHAGIEAGIVWTLHALLRTRRVAAIGIACTWYPGHSAAASIDDHLTTALA